MDDTDSANKPQAPKLADKAEWYFEQARLQGAPEDHAAHHIAYFLRWLDSRDLTSTVFREETEALSAVRQGTLTWPRLVLEHWDGCLLPDMVTPEANAFGAAYYSHARGRFWDDYLTTLAITNRRLALQTPFTDENYAKLVPVFDQRLAEWRFAPESVIKPLGSGGKIGVGCLILGPLLLIGGLLSFAISFLVQHFGSKEVAGLIKLGSFFAMVTGLATVGALMLFAYASRRRKARQAARESK